MRALYPILICQKPYPVSLLSAVRTSEKRGMSSGQRYQVATTGGCKTIFSHGKYGRQFSGLRGTDMRNQFWSFLFLLSFLLASGHFAHATNAGLALSADGSLFRKISPVQLAKVICARDAKTMWSCPNGNTCVNVSGKWKCKPPGIAPMSCNVCYSNQKRDSVCSGGTLMQQSACVNRANAELKKCLSHCQ